MLFDELLKNADMDTLKEYVLRINNEIEARHNEKFNRRVDEICKLLEELRRDYPWVDYNIIIEEGNGEYNLFDVVDKFTTDNFTF